MKVIWMADEHHHCALPEMDIPTGSLGRCECGRYWVYDPIPWEQTWRPLRPWPFDRRQRHAALGDYLRVEA